MKISNKKLLQYPTISVVLPTFNSAVTVEKCLKSVRDQNYPQKSIEIIIVDGGSRDKTKEIVSKYKVKWIDVDPKKQNVELNKSIGIQKAQGDLLLFLDHDNVLQNNKLISEMVKPFVEHADMVGVETLRYHYDKSSSLLDKYIALFAVTDPLAFYLGKADRLPYIFDKPDKKYKMVDYGDYYVVNFTESNLPTIGANGFMIRRKTLVRYGNASPGKFYHIDVNVDLIRHGYNTYAFVKDSVSHLGGRGSVINYLTRRMFFMKQYYFNEENAISRSKRRYALYEKKDFWKLIAFIIISLTFIVPIVDSLRGYLKVRDSAWFIHPILCFGFVVIYGYVIIEHQIKSWV